MPAEVIGVRLHFQQQIDFFRAKIALPTARWDDIQRMAHDRAFIVAGAAKADLLADLQAAVADAIAGNTTLDEFRREFEAIVSRNGWTGWTGEDTPAGRAWRTKVIYQTNMATSYAAGRWQQLNDPELLRLRPYWKYRHADGVIHPRPLHVSWDGLVLSPDDPFWETHFPPNGWGCHCFVVAVSREDYATAQASGRASPPGGWDAIDPKTGTMVGIDKGFDYAPGASVASDFQDFIDQKLINLSAPIGAAMWDALAPILEAEQRAALAAMVDAAAASMQPAGNAALAYVVTPTTVTDLARQGVTLESADIWLRDAELIHALRDIKTSRGATLSEEVWRNLPAYLDQATVYLDTQDTALIYVFDAPDGPGKVVVRVNFTSKIQSGGKRNKITSNFIRTGGLVDATNVVTETARYVRLGG